MITASGLLYKDFAWKANVPRMLHEGARDDRFDEVTLKALWSICLELLNTQRPRPDYNHNLLRTYSCVL